jgi:hypothetical protein
MDPSPSTIISGIVLPMSEAGPGGVVRIGVIVKNSLGCEVVMDVASAAIVTLSPPSLDSLAARFLPATPDGGSASGSDTNSTSPGPDSTAVGHRTVPVSLWPQELTLQSKPSRRYSPLLCGLSLSPPPLAPSHPHTLHTILHCSTHL